MKKAVLLLMLFGLICGGCSTSPYVSQDMFLSEHGFVALSNSNYLEAEAYLLAALDINQNNPYTILNLGVVFQDTERTRKAIQMYQKVLEMNPEEIAVKSNREGYSGKKIAVLAGENLKSLGVFISQKDPALNNEGLKKPVVTDSEEKSVALPYEAHSRMISHSAAVYASVLGPEKSQDAVDMASMGGPPGVGASSDGPYREAASGAEPTVSGSGDASSGSSSGGTSGDAGGGDDGD